MAALAPEAVPAALAAVAAEQARLSALALALAARLALLARQEEPEQILTLRQAAQRLGRTPDWLTRHQSDPEIARFTIRREGRHPRFSSRGIAAYLAAAAG